MITMLIITRAVHIAASILVAGIFTFDLVMLGSTERSLSNDLDGVERRLIHLALWNLIAALVSALFWFWLEVASMSGLPLKNTFSTSAWGTVLLGTRFGRVWQIRVGLIATAFVLIAAILAQAKARKVLIPVLWLISIVILVSLARISHVAAATEDPFGVLSDVVHLCAAGLWIGELVPLTIFLAGVRGSFSLGETATCVLHRFSTLSLCSVSVLVLSGISNSWLLVGSIHALFTTSYGRLLLVKLTLFAILIAIGARNRFLIKLKPLRGSADPNLLSQIRRNVISEAWLGFAVVLIVACLGVTPPARHP